MEGWTEGWGRRSQPRSSGAAGGGLARRAKRVRGVPHGLAAKGSGTVPLALDVGLAQRGLWSRLVARLSGRTGKLPQESALDTRRYMFPGFWLWAPSSSLVFLVT